MRSFILCTFCLLLINFSSAQYQIGLVPRVSPDQSVSQIIGYTNVTINYASPSVKEREVLGNLIPYGKVWRAGANNATTVEFSTPVIINKQSIPTGKYSFFVIANENDKWEVIFNKIHKQWGAFKYDENEDIVRILIQPSFYQNSLENLTYKLNQSSFEKGSIILSWDTFEIEVPFETTYIESFLENVEERAKATDEHIRWVVYLQGAEHLLKSEKKLEMAIKWIVKAEEIMNVETKWDENYYPRDYIQSHVMWIKAQLLAKNGKYNDAIQCIEELKSYPNQMFYERENEYEGIDRKSDEWK